MTFPCPQQQQQCFHYRCDEIDDRGWGCVFRSMQNATYLLGCAVSMRDMVHFFGISWIEPAMLIPFLPECTEGKTYLYLKNSDATKRMKYTVPAQYHYRLKNLSDLLHLARTGYQLVIDDGTLAFCLNYNNLTYWLIDPHTTDSSCAPKKLSDPLQFLARSDCWMVLAIKKKGI